MVAPFRHRSNPSLIFGSGSIRELPECLGNVSRILVVTGRHFPSTDSWSLLEKELASAGISYQRETVSGEPTPEIVDSLTSSARSAGVDAVAAIGGGSVLDAGKAVAAMLCHEGSVFDYLEGVGTKMPEGRTLPLAALPTTAGTGSEATKNAVISRRGPGGFKKSLRHDAYIPAAAIIDPDLAVGCPADISRACGMDAFSQLLESYVSTGATPFTDIMACDGLTHFALGSELFAQKAYGSTDEAGLRGELALAAYYSGLTLANAGLGTVHGLAGPLGAACDVPHGAACGLLVAPVFRLLAEKARIAAEGDAFLKRLSFAGALLSRSEDTSAEDHVPALIDLLYSWSEELPRLKTFGLDEKDLDGIVDGSGNKNSPFTLSTEEMKAVLAEIL